MQPASNSNETVARPVSTATAEHYAWGSGCDGWHLLRRPDVSIIQESMPPQTAEVPHYHERSRQFFFVPTGSLSVSTSDGDHVLSAEQGIEIAPRVRHHVRNASDSTTRFLVISSPPSHGDRVVIGNVHDQ